jgi:hypothetical protein
MSDSMRNFLDWMAGTPLRILIILIGAAFIQTFGSRAITRAMNRLASADLVLGPRNIVARQKERASTIGGVLTATLKSATWIIAMAMALGEFGFDLGPLIASAGIVGVAVGLGAQTLVRDILSGIFMLIEDQYGVGDSVSVLEVEGVVEKVGLRVTTVRDGQGTLWYLRNGEILKVGNQSLHHQSQSALPATMHRARRYQSKIVHDAYEDEGVHGFPGRYQVRPNTVLKTIANVAQHLANRFLDTLDARSDQLQLLHKTGTPNLRRTFRHRLVRRNYSCERSLSEATPSSATGIAAARQSHP